MRRWVFTDDTLGDSSRQVLVTLAAPDPESGSPERIDVATRGASWETWSRPLAIDYVDHDSGSAPSRYMGKERTYVNEDSSAHTLYLDRDEADAVIHALREVYLFDGPTGSADYPAAVRIIAALGGDVSDPD